MSHNFVSGHPVSSLHHAASSFERSDASSPLVLECSERSVQVSDCVAAWAIKTPHALAAASDTETLSYLELDRQSTQLARYLVGLGVGPEVLVGVYLARSLESIIAWLAILKAGGAYLPLDPAYPPDRASFMLQDAGVPVLITRTPLIPRLPNGSWNIVALDALTPELDSHPGCGSPNEVGVLWNRNCPNAGTKSGNLAYVIYTSGSTGTPKGVQIEHGSLWNLICWHMCAFSVTSADRAGHLASVGFDAATWEVWPYLSAGASIHIADDTTRTSTQLLRDWIVKNRITISFLPTALAERMIDLEWPSDTKLRVLLTGADTLHRYPPSDLPFQLVNNYGPTECTVVSTSGIVSPRVQCNALPPIGRPITNTQIYILDENLNQVGAGMKGELYIAGTGVSRGYVNRPDLNTQKFFSDPFSREAGARLYRTGDLGRYLPDGQIEFLGRIDEQIKIRGYRIEPAEIVTMLDSHPTIHSSAVVARENVTGETGLVAYIVPAPGGSPTRCLLQSFLRQRLPEYMIPAVFIRLDTLPLTANGKVDYSSLPNPSTDNILDDGDFLAPRSPIEQRVAEILAALLGLKRVGINDNFFLLGGHSLLGTQLIARLRSTFGVELSLRSLFDHPRVAGLSAEIEKLIISKLQANGADR